MPPSHAPSSASRCGWAAAPPAPCINAQQRGQKGLTSGREREQAEAAAEALLRRPTCTAMLAAGEAPIQASPPAHGLPWWEQAPAVHQMVPQPQHHALDGGGGVCDQEICAQQGRQGRAMQRAFSS